MSLSSTLSRNEKVEQYIRKKTDKPNAVNFWIEGDVIFFYVKFLWFCHSDYPTLIIYDNV